MDYERGESADLQADLVDDLREEIKLLQKKIGEHSGINDIFLSIKDAAKILKVGQYQELTVTDQETGQEYKVFTVNKDTIDMIGKVKRVRTFVEANMTSKDPSYSLMVGLMTILDDKNAE